jgi:hypothetical protein
VAGTLNHWGRDVSNESTCEILAVSISLPIYPR